MAKQPWSLLLESLNFDQIHMLGLHGISFIRVPILKYFQSKDLRTNTIRYYREENKAQRGYKEH